MERNRPAPAASEWRAFRVELKETTIVRKKVIVAATGYDDALERVKEGDGIVIFHDESFDIEPTVYLLKEERSDDSTD